MGLSSIKEMNISVGNLVAVSKDLMGEYSKDAVWLFFEVAILSIEVPNKRTRPNRQKSLLSFPEGKEKDFRNEGSQRLEQHAQRIYGISTLPDSQNSTPHGP